MTVEAPIFWLDTETTGLEPDEGHLLLEVAYVITDAELNEITHASSVIRHSPYYARSLMDDYVREMHEANGLLEALERDGCELRVVEQEIIAAVREHCGDFRPPVAGNSLTLDRKFLHRFMPELNDEVLSYRPIDVSTLNELAVRWDPAIAELATTGKQKNMPAASAEAVQERPAHRALHDIRESIAELRVYREHGFVGGA